MYPVLVSAEGWRSDDGGMMVCRQKAGGLTTGPCVLHDEGLALLDVDVAALSLGEAAPEVAAMEADAA